MADFDKLVNDKPVSENGGTEKKSTVLQDTYTDEEIHDVNNTGRAQSVCPENMQHAGPHLSSRPSCFPF